MAYFGTDPNGKPTFDPAGNAQDLNPDADLSDYEFTESTMALRHTFQTKLRFISDNSHGWLEVPTEDVEASGYIPSQFSYVDIADQFETPHTYLEEDADVLGYFKARGLSHLTFEQQGNEIVDVQMGAAQAWIRNLPHCDGVGYVSPFGGN